MKDAAEARLRELGIVAIRAARRDGVWRVIVLTLSGVEVVTEADTFFDALSQAAHEIRTNHTILPN